MGADGFGIASNGDFGLRLERLPLRWITPRGEGRAELEVREGIADEGPFDAGLVNVADDMAIGKRRRRF